MKISDRMQAIGLAAVIVGSLALAAINVTIAYSAISAPTATAMLLPQGRSVRAGDVGCSRFPKLCCQNDKDRKGKC